MKSMLWLIVTLLTAGIVNAQLFQQDFGTRQAPVGGVASFPVGTYVNASPSNQQFTAVTAGHSSVTLSVPDASEDATFPFRFKSATTSGSSVWAVTRNANFSSIPNTLIVQFDLSATSGSSGSSPKWFFWVGSGFSNTVSAEANANIHSGFSIRWVSTPNFVFRAFDGTESSTMSGASGNTRLVTFVTNNSGSSITYLAPDGNNETVANDTYDLWAGTTKIFNDKPAVTPSQSLSNFKFGEFFTSSVGRGNMSIDNLQMDPIGIAPMVTTVSPVSPVGSTTATFNGNLTDLGSAAVTSRGFVVGAAATTPTISSNLFNFNETTGLPGFSAVPFSKNATGLSAATSYVVRAYATNSAGTSYGSPVNFSTLDGPPSVTIGSLGTVTISGGPITGNNVTGTGGAASISARGIVYNKTNSAPSIATDYVAPHASGGLGNFDITLAGLDPGTTYYAWAYATNSNGLSGYSNNSVSFTTKANYKSKTSGDWDQPGTWLVFNGSSWMDANSTPTDADGTIEIVGGHTVNVDAAVTADEVTVNGTLKVSISGTSFPGMVVNGTYQHDIDDKSIPIATWNNGSELLLSGFMTPTSGSTSALGNMNQSFANITFDCPDYNTAISASSIVMVSGSGFSMKAGSKLWFKNVGNGGNITLTSTGNVITIPILQIDDDYVAINRNAGGDRTVNVGDLIMNGGTLYVNWSNGNSNDGILNLSGNLTMAPSANMEFRKGSGSPQAFVNLTGATKNLQFGTVTDAINFSVTNGPATLLSNWPIPAGSLDVDGQLVNTGAFKVSLGSSVSLSRTNGYINGNLEKGVGVATASKAFEIGDASGYRPVTIAFLGNPTNGSGSLLASTVAGDRSGLTAAGIDPNKSVNRYFTVENNGVSGYGSFNITMEYAPGEMDGGIILGNLKVRKYSLTTDPNWIPASSETTGTNATTGNNTITGNGFVSFSDFVIGELAPSSITTTATIEDATATYGDTEVTLTGGIDPSNALGTTKFYVDDQEITDLVTRIGANATVTFNPSGLAVGTHKIQAKFTGSDNYLSSESEEGELEIHPKPLTVTITAENKVYDGNADASTGTGSVSGIVGSEDVSVVVSGGQFDNKNVGVGKPVIVNLALMGVDKGNYTIELTAATTANITSKPVTVYITADDKTYDGTASAEVAISTVDELMDGDVTASATNGQFADKNAGEDKTVTATVALLGTAEALANYHLTSAVAETTADINKLEVTVEITANSKTYDGNTSATVAAVNPVLGKIAGDDVSAVASNGHFDDENAGDDKTVTADLSLTGADAGNYSLSSTTAEALANINKATLTVIIHNKEKYCGQANPTLTGTVSGIIGSESLTVDYSTAATASYLVGEYDIDANVTGATIDNYEVQVTKGKLTINGTTIDASASSKPVRLGDVATLSAIVSPIAADVQVTFYLNDVPKCTVYTNAAGVATKDISGLEIGVYKVKAVVGGGCSDAIAYLPVYDPNGAFVTGGGWIMSPAGAYADDAALTGKANFGFNAKYKKGSNAVDGNTEFQFQAGNLNFKSSENTAGTLVIAGAKANFKGKGMINGVSGYSFMVSGIDGDVSGGGGVDKFRIKIWNTTTSVIVYDNNMGQDENGVPTTCLGGGSIVIHEVKGGKTSQKVDPDVLVTSLDARVFNNPAAGASSFRLKLLSPDAEHPINVKVVDMTGKSLQAVQSTAGQTVEFGATFRSGMYIAEISQNGQRKLVKLVKQ